MTSRSDVLLTAGDLLKWREEDKQLDEQIHQLQQRRSEIKRKLDAAEVFAGALSLVVANPLPSKVNGHDTGESSDSPPELLCANLRKTGESLTVRQIRERLIELGFEDKLKAQSNFPYGLVYRLSKSGKLLKRGSKYRAPPTSSPEGETGALGAPAHR
jgi:hypothetical protein